MYHSILGLRVIKKKKVQKLIDTFVARSFQCANNTPKSTRNESEIQGYLAHKKPPPPPRTVTGPYAQAYCRVQRKGRRRALRRSSLISTLPGLFFLITLKPRVE